MTEGHRMKLEATHQWTFQTLFLCQKYIDVEIFPHYFPRRAKFLGFIADKFNFRTRIVHFFSP